MSDANAARPDELRGREHSAAVAFWGSKKRSHPSQKVRKWVQVGSFLLNYKLEGFRWARGRPMRT